MLYEDHYVDPYEEEYHEKMTAVEDLLDKTVRSLVAHPNEVKLIRTETDTTILYEIDVVSDDRGKIIGRHGRILESMKVLFHALGCKNGKRIHLEIHE